MDELLKQKRQLSDMLVDAINYNNKDKVLELAMKAAMVIDRIKDDSNKEEGDSIVCARCNNKYPEDDMTQCESPLFQCDSYLCEKCYTRVGTYCPRCEEALDGDSISVCDRCSRAWPSSKTYECSNTECVGTCLCQECYNDFDKKCRTCYEKTNVEYTCCICNENFCDTDVKSCKNEDCINYICTNCSDNGEITLCPDCEKVVQFCSECQEMLLNEDDMTKHTEDDGTIIVTCTHCSQECSCCDGLANNGCYQCTNGDCDAFICDDCYNNGSRYCPDCEEIMVSCSECGAKLYDNDDMTKHTKKDGTIIVCCANCNTICNVCSGPAHPNGYKCNSENCDERICDDCYEDEEYYCSDCTSQLDIIDEVREAINAYDTFTAVNIIINNYDELHDNFIDNDTLNIVVTDQWKDDGWGEVKRKLKDVTPGSTYYYVDGYGNYKDVTDEMLSNMIDELEKKTIGNNERIDN